MSKGIVYVEKAGQAPSPSKDFHQLVVTETEVIWRTWRIALRRDERGIPPNQKKVLWADFEQEELIQSDINRVFGEEMLRLVHGIACGDWLVRLPPRVIVRLTRFLGVIDVVRLSSLNRYMRNVCCSDDVWRRIVYLHSDIVTDEMKAMAKDIGWRKAFLTNKMHLRLKTKQKGKKLH
ncbi:F-box only protein 36 [Exaiptasia diaphana]|uniref:F-box domain-containing protein n=1 Tax=Exaiptasia diaphana TaxID=2652724 RepID=A0A913WXV9_EXADI|nr:F-box only protein 36 [Exaiptasia diaphana]